MGAKWLRWESIQFRRAGKNESQWEPLPLTSTSPAVADPKQNNSISTDLSESTRVFYLDLRGMSSLLKNLWPYYFLLCLKLHFLPLLIALKYCSQKVWLTHYNDLKFEIEYSTCVSPHVTKPMRARLKASWISHSLFESVSVWDSVKIHWIGQYSTTDFFQWCYIDWNSVNFGWFLETLTVSNLECHPILIVRNCDPHGRLNLCGLRRW